ncbi:unnamed protein product [Trichogramma brassicae]|uniref:U2 snRNP-associated SURP motif-containing protein n=1 Tax=Trichogramma brassicae TaxID=86971 RepID=A0A6H5HRR8_9HYME|nr:unnamed protein product [Trichogramma brassicae]
MSDKGLMKQLTEQKLKAFSIGTMGKRPMSKKEVEEIRKKEQEQAAAQAFEEFVATFHNDNNKNSSKVWVKAGTYDAGKRQEDTKEKGKLYKPQPKMGDFGAPDSGPDYTKFLITSNERKQDRLGKKEKRWRKKEKEIMLGFTEGSFDNGDPNTTNLYLGNLNPKITEQQLMEIFGKYGPLASIKIMWPRSDEEKARQRNCGFVAFMCRKDGERALKNLNGRDVMQYEMKLGWALIDLTQPPPPSGLPFNAQPHRRDKNKLPRIRNLQNPDPQDKENFEKNSSECKFVVREGPMFEAMIMNREINNPMFRFLFENHSPAHTYYRWKMFSILQGETPKEWRTEDFRMFKGGSIWRPPPMNPWTQGMPEDLVEPDEKPESRRGTLSNIAEAMVFCIEHAEAAEEICDCIAESLSILQTPVNKKIARLYLISDILHNCGVKVNNATIFRKAFECRLIEIFSAVHLAYKQFDSRLKAEGFKVRMMRIFRAWEDWAVYPREFLVKLQNTFLGLNQVTEEPEQEAEEDIDGMPLSDADNDVAEDLDGVPLDGAALLKGAMKLGLASKPKPSYDDIDGVPMDDDIDGVPMDDEDDDGDSGANRARGGGGGSDSNDKLYMPGFVPSKWETVDPDQVEAQAMTTNKWDELEQNDDSQENSIDSRDYNEERRNKLREIEVKAMQYQDELEIGKRSIKPGMSIQAQVEHYRKKLIKKSERDSKDSKKQRSASPDSQPPTPYYKDSRSSRRGSQSPLPLSKSSSRYRSRSKSPRGKRGGRSRSPLHKKSRSQITPSPPRMRRSPSPNFSSSRSSRKSPDRKRRGGRSPSNSPTPSSRSSKHRAASPMSPTPRKHRHKHKY